MAKDISRRSFLKALGGGAVASSALLAACKDDKQTTASQQEPEKGKMTYRVNPNTRDRVSLLGYYLSDDADDPTRFALPDVTL